MIRSTAPGSVGFAVASEDPHPLNLGIQHMGEVEDESVLERGFGVGMRGLVSGV